MAGKMNSKGRLVRCPRCRKVLPEPPDVVVYECGGCGTRLQAKKRNNSTLDATLQKPHEDSLGKQKVDNVFVDQEAGSSSNQQPVINSTNGSDQNSDHIDVDSSSKDEDAAKIAENGTVDAPPSVVEEHLSESLKIKQLSDDQEPCSSSDQRLVVNSNDEPDQKIHNDPRSSTEFSGHEYPESSPEATAHNKIVQHQEHEHEHEQEPEKNQKTEHSSGKQKTEQLSDGNETTNRFAQLWLVNPMNVLNQNNDQSEHHSSSELSYHDEPESSPEATTHNKVDQHQEHEHEQEPEQNQKTEHSSGKQEQLSDGNETANSFAHLWLVNPMNVLNRNNDQSEHRSSSELSYHDEPESSPEATVNTKVKRHETEIEESSSEIEETVANRKIVSDSAGGSKSSFKNMIAENLLDTRQKKTAHPDEDELLSEDGSADLRPKRNFGRISSAESMETARPGGVNYYGYEGSVSSFDGNDDQVPRKNNIGSKRDDEHIHSGHKYRFNRRNGHPFTGRISKDEHQSTDVRSFYGLNEYRDNLRHRPSMIPENPKMERIELLKLVRELQDQLERTNISNPHQVPSYYNHVLNSSVRYGQRMAFSGEATVVNRRRDASSCHHCCPQDRHFSAQLPSHHVCCNEPSYRLNSYHSPRFSGPSSPRHNHSESNFSTADDHWQHNDIRKPFRSPKKKRYVRPIAGGSPWITCYHCFKLLELPQSFLLFKKRYHSLKCGACSKVLNFTLSDRTHVSRYYPEEMIAAPPSSEAEDYDKQGGSWAGPVSYSDRSFQKSYSTETDRNGSLSRKLSEEKRKANMSRDPSGSTRPPSSRKSGRRKTMSEIEEVQPGRSGSPLHWLMGYASPSKVIRG